MDARVCPCPAGCDRVCFCPPDSPEGGFFLLTFSLEGEASPLFLMTSIMVMTIALIRF